MASTNNGAGANLMPSAKHRKATSKHSRKKQLMAMQQLKTGDDHLLLAYNGMADKQVSSVQNNQKQLITPSATSKAGLMAGNNV